MRENLHHPNCIGHVINSYGCTVPDEALSGTQPDSPEGKKCCEECNCIQECKDECIFHNDDCLCHQPETTHEKEECLCYCHEVAKQSPWFEHLDHKYCAYYVPTPQNTEEISAKEVVKSYTQGVENGYRAGHLAMKEEIEKIIEENLERAVFVVLRRNKRETTEGTVRRSAYTLLLEEIRENI